MKTNSTFFEYFQKTKNKQIKDIISKCGKLDARASSILITGETGTGKDIMAHYIHARTCRVTAPLLKINMRAIPPELLESELFGHEKGAFTSATLMKKGNLEMAQGGTIIFDEIGDMDLYLQAKLFHFLDDRLITRVGGVQPIKINVRVIATTNINLPEHVKDGKFRKDLFYRISGIHFHLPALRERLNDLELLISFYSSAKLTPEALIFLKGYNFPGNIRELKDLITRIELFELTPNSKEITVKQIIRNIKSVESSELIQSTFGAEEMPRTTFKNSFNLKIGIKKIIVAALESCDWSQQDAAKLLGVNSVQVHRLTIKYKINPPSDLKTRWQGNR